MHLKKNIVVTGADGFIAKNLCVMLAERGYENLIKINRDSTEKEFQESLEKADFIFHLAGVNRAKSEKDFFKGNIELTKSITSFLIKRNKKVPIMFSSSTQANSNNTYGNSKNHAEKIIEDYGTINDSSYFICRLPNVFGKWCRPNYNSFIATFCYNLVNGLNIKINDDKAKVTLVYIDDVCRKLIELLNGECMNGHFDINPKYQTSVGEVAEILKNFKFSEATHSAGAVGKGLKRALYSTYLSYKSPKQFSYNIKGNTDDRGIFCEMLRTSDSGQFSFFTAHPGITRGGHYHHTKNEKFFIVKGKALYKFEHIATGEKFELQVCDKDFKVVETVPGWAHNITNIGDEEMIVMLWANEVFDKESPDTFVKAL